MSDLGLRVRKNDNSISERTKVKAKRVLSPCSPNVSADLPKLAKIAKNFELRKTSDSSSQATIDVDTQTDVIFGGNDPIFEDEGCAEEYVYADDPPESYWHRLYGTLSSRLDRLEKSNGECLSSIQRLCDERAERESTLAICIEMAEEMGIDTRQLLVDMDDDEEKSEPHESTGLDRGCTAVVNFDDEDEKNSS